jgi:hypothetical protein
MFVPVIIPTQDASPHAQELGRRIAALIRDYRLQHQDASSTDVHFALRIAAREAGGLGRRRALVLVVSVVALVLGASVALFAHSGRGEPAFPMVAIAGLILILLVAVILVKSRIG